MAVKNNQFEAFKILVEHLKTHNKEDVLSKKDELGNTVLHLAVSRKQHEVVDFLLDEHNVTKGAVEVNSLNERGLTPLDVLLLFQSEAGDREIEDILRRAGALNANAETMASNIPSQAMNTTAAIYNTTTDDQSDRVHSHLEWLDYFKFNKSRDSPSEARNCLLVIAALIATATYQAVLSPPGGVWQDDSSGWSYNNNNNNNGTKSTSTIPPHIAGQSIMGSHSLVPYYIFLLTNSVGFYLSLYVIQVLSADFPMSLELNISLLALLSNYGMSSIFLSNGIFFVVYCLWTPIFGLLLWRSVIMRCICKKRGGSVLSRNDVAGLSV